MMPYTALFKDLKNIVIAFLIVPKAIKFTKENNCESVSARLPVCSQLSVIPLLFKSHIPETMKKLFLVLLATTTHFINAQNVNIACHFSMASEDSCGIRLDKYYIREYEPFFKTVLKNNECTFKFTIDKPTMAEFSYNKQSVNIWLEPNDYLKLNIEYDSLYKAISMEGTGISANEFLKSFYKTFKNDYDKDAIKQRMLNTGIDIFENNLFKERKKQTEFLKNYKNKEKFSSSFTAYITNLVKYNYFYQLQAFPIVNANESKAILAVTPVPALLLEEVTPELANNDEALNCDAYRQFLYYYIIYNTSRLNNFNKFTDNSISMEKKMGVTNQTILGKSNIYFIASFLNENVGSVSPFTTKHIFELLSYNEKNGEYTKLVKAKCEQRIKTKVVEDKTVASASSGKGEATSGVKILGTDGKYFTFDDLKGKVVYVDFWASWCGPCRGQFPFSKELHKKFTSKQLKNVVFLYISIDKTEDMWKKAIEQNGIGDFKNGLVPGDWSSEIAKYFQISSIPRYMLIDKKGNFVDLNAKRPSEETIYDDIVNLIEK